MTTPTTNETTLKKAKADAVNLQAKLDIDATNAARADMLTVDARERLAALEADRNRLHAEAGDALADRITSGAADDFAITHNTIDGLIQEAVTTVAITSAAAKKLRDRHMATLSELHRARTAAGNAADLVMLDRAEALAETFRRKWTDMLETGEALRSLTGRGLDIPINVGKRILPDSVREMLLLLPERDGIHTPVNVLRGDVTQADHWATARQALIDGA